MKTLRSKMMAIALCPVIISAILIGMIGFWSVSDIMTTYSEAVLVSIAQEQADGMERVFENIEHSAQIMQKCVQKEITSVDDLKNADYENREALLDSFKAKIKAQKTVNKEYELVVACGMSAYRETDIHFEDIFQRADKAMYENKLALKQQSESVVLPTVLCHV